MSGAPTLTYCTNVHPSETLEEMQHSLLHATVPLARRLAAQGFPAVFPVGLYLSAASVERLQDDSTRSRFRDFLAEHSLAVVTLNCFPYGGFHESGLKERVFEPGWQDRRRLEYSVAAAHVLADLFDGPGVTSISTLSGAWKLVTNQAEVEAAMAAHLAEAARELQTIHERTGCEIVLSLEPEPLSTLETSAETVAFFERFLDDPDEGERRRRHIGVCYDTCHQAVEFEETGVAMRAIHDAGIRFGKVQLSSAPVLRRPADHPDALRFLAGFDEPRFLHQTVTRTGDGQLQRYHDLPEFLALSASDMARVEEARVHFHVPIDRDDSPPLGTTRSQMLEAVDFALALPEPPLLEVETYTFGVLPEFAGRPPQGEELLGCLARELISARVHLEEGGENP